MKNAIELLAKRQIAFFELATANSDSVPTLVPREEREKIRRKPFLRLQLDKRGTAGCIHPTQEKWLAYQLLSQGMKPGECLSLSSTTSPTGRFLFTETRNKLLGASLHKYHLTDKSGEFPSTTIFSAWSSGPNSLGAAFASAMIPRFHKSCRANLESIVAAFPQVPLITARQVTRLGQVPTQSGESLSIRLVPTALNANDLRALEEKLEAVPPSEDAPRVAVQGSNAIVVQDNMVVAHFDFSEWKKSAFSETVYASKSHILLLVLDSAGARLAAFTPDITDMRVYTLTVGESGDNFFLLRNSEAVVKNNKLLVLGYPKLASKSSVEPRVFEADLEFLSDNQWLQPAISMDKY